MLYVDHLKIHFHSAAPERFAVNDISFHIAPGEILGLVGESGSGKSVTAMSIAGLLPYHKLDYSGSVRLRDHELLGLPPKDMSRILGREIGIVFQEPMSSLNPLMKIGPQVEESLRIHTKLSPTERRVKALTAMAEADLPTPELLYDRYPHEFSGGMLQRVMIAAAIIGSPGLLLADEPTTALDVTIQGQILELLRHINKTKGTSILFISHDLKIVRKLCHRVIVMKRGHIVEAGTADEVFYHPAHEYTKHLIACIPSRDKRILIS